MTTSSLLVDGGYTASDAARLLGVKPSTVRKWIRQGHAKSFRTIGRSRLLTLDEVHRLDRNRPRVGRPSKAAA